MKESYFTPETRTETASAMLAELFPDGQKRSKRLKSGQAALLVLDMQQYFLESTSHAFVPSAPCILPVLNSLASRFARLARPVIFTQHINDHSNAGSLGEWWRDLITRDHPFHSLAPSLDLGAGQVLEKPQYDAFFQTDLADRLAAHDVRQVVIGGVMTHLCCETTARSAFVRGFEVFFLVDGTATYQRDFHMASLRNLGHGFATLMTSDQVIRFLSAHS